MPGYERHYDYGMRGYRQTTRPFSPYVSGPSGYDRPYLPRYDAGYSRGWNRWGARPPEMPRHVTARYNLDYVIGDRGDHYPLSYNMYGGDRVQRNGDSRYYRQPYMTNGGSRTLRGSNFPTGYDYPDYGPEYGGRYSDEF
jgi:hypothetical protein